MITRRMRSQKQVVSPILCSGQVQASMYDCSQSERKSIMGSESNNAKGIYSLIYLFYVSAIKYKVENGS